MADIWGIYIYSSSEQEPEETYAPKQQFQITVLM